jgi:hypothetical protein
MGWTDRRWRGKERKTLRVEERMAAGRERCIAVTDAK